MGENNTAEANHCECSRYSVLVNLREDGAGDLEYDEELTTGCGATARKLFAQGHDAKLKSFLIKAGAAGHEVRRDDGAVVSVADAATHAARYTFGHLIVAGIQRAETRAAVKAERQDRKAAARQETQTRRAAREARRAAKPKVVKGKVGRWSYLGQVVDGQFIYRDAKGNEKTTTKFQLA
ncbi:hypothetical protein ABZT17_25235 [Streptomyces sp. NPDC005648]|uniref:hypothetical protein n=1 Tax=Streptomyces sp. NPDC005648 TaxID=3157044 RepID=UPI0033A2EB86